MKVMSSSPGLMDKKRGERVWASETTPPGVDSVYAKPVFRYSLKSASMSSSVISEKGLVVAGTAGRSVVFEVI